MDGKDHFVFFKISKKGLDFVKLVGNTETQGGLRVGKLLQANERRESCRAERRNIGDVGKKTKANANIKRR